MDIGFSSCHLYQIDEEFIQQTVDSLDHLNYQRFEISHEHYPQKKGLGAVDDFIQYPVLKKLNDKKMYDPERLEILRRVLGKVKESGKETSLWSHELATPKEILEIYPELKTPKGDIDLSNPLLQEWLTSKYETFFQVCPEVDAIVLVMTEVAFPVAHRFDNKWSAEECIYWLIKNVHDVCCEHRKKLIVRPFSAIVDDYRAAQNALSRLPNSIEIMVKSDPFDWNPFLPMNPALKEYSPERLTVEFDLGSEYFGRGTLPVIYPEYLKARLDHVKSLGINRVIGRVDRKGVSALDREGRLNVDYFYNYAKTSTTGNLALRADKYYQSKDSQLLVAQLEKAFEVVKGTLYVDGQLLWHRLYGDINQAQTALVFESLRPEIPLDHGVDEWHLLSNRTTPSIQQVREEKDRAVNDAGKILKVIKEIAPGEKGLIQRANNLVLISRLYRDSVICMQEYVCCLTKADIQGFELALESLQSTADLLEKSNERIVQKLAVSARKNVHDFRQLFFDEKKIYSEKPGLNDDEKGKVVDIIAVGYPGEGHAIQKFTHGSACNSDENSRFRTISRYLSYKLLIPEGNYKLLTTAKGAVKISINHQDSALKECLFDLKTWQRIEIPFSSKYSLGELRVCIEKNGNPPPALKSIFITEE